LDGDSFFVAVEVAKNPALRGKPVVTGSERGIVTAASYEAKALGVTRGLPIFRLRQKFPQVIILPGDYAAYVKYSEMMFDIVRRYADDVEEYSIDECFADLTGLDKPLKMSYTEIAARIKDEITNELDLSVSVGVAPTKSLAKVASKWKKPNGLTVIPYEKITEYISQVPIGKVWGIGSATSQFLQKRGIKTAADLAAMKREWILENVDRPVQTIWHELNGTAILEIDPNPKTLYSSIQKTRTFHPATNDKVFLLSQLSKHIEDACAKARHFDLVPKGASIFLKTSDFRYANRTLPLSFPTNAPEALITLAVRELDIMYAPGIRYRTAGVRLYELTPSEALSTDLFGNTARDEKFEKIHKTIDALEEKYGKRVVHLASTKKALDHDEEGEGSDGEDLDRNLLFL
jgi:DNA polymerase-4